MTNKEIVQLFLAIQTDDDYDFLVRHIQNKLNVKTNLKNNFCIIDGDKCIEFGKLYSKYKLCFINLKSNKKDIYYIKRKVK